MPEFRNQYTSSPTMQIIKLSATDSTNAHLKKMLLSGVLNDFTVVVAEQQTKGRGQVGTAWLSESGKNLTFSVLKLIDKVSVKEQFLINICVSLSIFKTLSDLQVPDLSIKWPNDILSGSAKICGILIENTLSGIQIQASIIGIGLNVNQTKFDNLPNASSLKLVLGKTYDLDEVLHNILLNLKKNFLNVESTSVEELWSDYEKVLFRKDKPSTFQDSKGEFFMGFIRGVSETGKLMVTLEDQVVKEFDLKDIKLLY